MPTWGLDDHFRDWGTFHAFLFPNKQQFMDGEKVKYWSSTRSAWVDAVVTGRQCDISGAVVSYNLDVRSRALPGKIRPRQKAYKSQAALVPDRCPSLLGEMCGISFIGPDGLRYHSVRWVALLDGTIKARLMTDSYPTIAPGHDSTFSEGILRGIRHVPWSPAHHRLFPQPCRQRMVFLTWVGNMVGLQTVWTKAVLPLVCWTDALPEPPRCGGIAESGAFVASSNPTDPEPVGLMDGLESSEPAEVWTSAEYPEQLTEELAEGELL